MSGWFYAGVWSTIVVGAWITSLAFHNTPSTVFATGLMMLTVWCMTYGVINDRRNE